ncbi:MAG: hypothetical protein COB69_04795, partial [Phycisphaera sp.]
MSTWQVLIVGPSLFFAGSLIAQFVVPFRAPTSTAHFISLAIASIAIIFAPVTILSVFEQRKLNKLK